MQKKEPDKQKIIYGRKPVKEALEQGIAFEKIWLQRGISKRFEEDIKKLAQKRHIAIQQVPSIKLEKLTKQKTHQGIAALSALIPYYEVDDILSNAYDKGEIPLFLICDGITDVRNFGAIARTAACTGVHAIIITQKGSVSINGEAMKTSAGALHRLPICKVRFLHETVAYLQQNGLQIVAADIRTEKYVADIDWNIPTALIMGAEGKGISQKLLQTANSVVKIPILSDFDSYNVSVATGMILYESMQQRKSDLI
jgi:23S rRNA (guanosine2251-2'-O)-methyltransferase